MSNVDAEGCQNSILLPAAAEANTVYSRGRESHAHRHAPVVVGIAQKDGKAAQSGRIVNAISCLSIEHSLSGQSQSQLLRLGYPVADSPHRR
jgi:hypothetical protein